MFEAARLGDPIEHTRALAGFLMGAIIGIALIAAVAFATFTCGFGVALLAGLAAGLGASGILSLGESIGKMFKTTTGAITLGSPNVFVNRKPAAFATASTASCSKHNPTAMVAEGSGNVFINSKPAARNGDAVTCGAKISKGSDDTFFGGGSVRYLPVDDEVPQWLRTTVDWAFALAGLVGGLAGLARVAGGLSRAMLPCAAKFIGGFVLGELAGRYVIAPAVGRVFGGLFGEPVDMATGRKLLPAEREIDCVVASPIPVVVKRFYASNLTHEGSLGRGWVLPWELSLQRRDGQIWYRDAQGRESGFPDVPPGHASFNNFEQRYLSCTHDGRLVVHDQNEMYFEFGPLAAEEGAIAHLCRIEDQAGQWQTYERDDSGRVTRIRTSGGQELKLAYSHVKGRLTSILGSTGTRGGTMVDYGYDAHGQLASVKDANGIVVRRFAYDENGLMASHTNALGFESRYEWECVEGEMRVVASHTSEGEHCRYGYDPQHRKSWVQDELGRIATWHYDEQFRIVRCTDRDGSRYATEYDDNGQPTELSLPGGRTVRLSYDKAGRLTGETDPLGRTTTTAYHGNGLRVSELTRPDGAQWRAQYDLQGRLLSTQDPLGRSERYEYPATLVPWPDAHVDAKGGRRTMEWDRRGLLLAQTDCSGKTTRYEYDGDGYLRATRDALDQRVTFTRRATGEITLVELPDGSQELFELDAAGGPIQHKTSAGLTRTWQRNARGQILRATDPAGRSLHYRYDNRGRLVSLANDNEAEYRFEYDTGDRLRSELRPDGIERQMRYDAAGHLEELVTIGTAEPTQTARREASPRPQRKTRFERDKLGRLLAKANAGGLTSYEWDEGDRLTGVQRMPGEPDGAADSIRFEYDRAGRLLAEHGVNGSVAYEHDALDNLIALALPHGQRIEQLNYGSGHVHQICSGTRVISDFERDDLHREIQRSQGALLHATGYDALGRKQWQSAALPTEAIGPERGKLWRSYRYTPAGELAEQHDSLRGRIGYHYDAAGQLLSQSRANAFEQFAWDAAGNLLDEIQRKSRGQVQDNRLRVWQDLRFDYDPWGNLRTKRKGSREVQHFHFDADDRLKAVLTENASGRLTVRFDYDALGRRIGKTEILEHTGTSEAAQMETRRFVWQGLRLVQEQRTGSVSNYVYSPDAAYIPLARMDVALEGAAPSDARIYHFHTDLVGAPQEVTDEAGELAWAGHAKAWGKTERGEDALLVPRIDQPLRYPGQYADESTGLHYNTFRYYDPEVGRFISQDPIGLLGGENLYAYAPNPTGWEDPFGLARTPGHFLEWIWQRPSTGQYREGIEFSGSDRSRPGRLTFSEQLDVHTEAKVLSKLEGSVQPGDKLYFRGTKDPCNPGGRGCASRMAEFAKRHGVEITYENKTTGHTQKYGC